MMQRWGALLVAGILVAIPSVVHAFCGFYVAGADSELYNNATQVVLMREGKRTVLSMRNNYQGPPEGFAMVVPVPVVLQEDNVKTLPDAVFERVEKLSAPRLVEYWEQDPCYVPEPRMERMDMEGAMANDYAPEPSAPPEDLGVTIEAQFDVGEYNIVILSAKDSGGLETWLTQQKYKIPAGAGPYLKPYVASGSKFFVAKVDPSKVSFKDGQAMLSPLRFHYDSEDFSLPVRLGLMNSSGNQDLLVHILAQGQRYEVANYPNVTIPTNINVKDDVRKGFAAFYAALFDSTLEKNPKAVVTEYSWDAGSCDPCPTPALDYNELATLGMDVLYMPASDDAPSRERRVLPAAGAPAIRAEAPRAMDRMPSLPPPPPSNFVLTRLHARYSAESLGEDLVFRAAKPIVGGREMMMEGKLETGARSDYSNNFQGRYAIRHEWKGAIDCKEPRRGIWGGPPSGAAPSPPEPATDLAFATRGSTNLASIVAQDVPEIGLVAGKTAATLPTASEDKTKDPQAAGEPEDKKKSKSKGCSASSSGGAGLASLLLVLLALGLVRRRGYELAQGGLEQ